QDLAGPPRDAGQASGEVALLVAREHDHRDGQAGSGSGHSGAPLRRSRPGDQVGVEAHQRLRNAWPREPRVHERAAGRSPPPPASAFRTSSARFTAALSSTGTPHAIASAAASPKFSWYDGKASSDAPAS